MTTADNHAPDSLKYKWLIYALVVRSAWATGLDKSVAFEIIENYRKEYGNSRASLRYLSEATGADRTNIVASLRRVVENGPFTVVRQGAGTRPTEYKIHFELVNGTPSGVVETTARAHSSGVAETTSCGVVGNTSKTPSGVVETTESLLPVPVTNRVQEKRDIDLGTATPPPLSGALGAARAGLPKEGRFNELFDVYDFRHKRAEARDAFNALPADIDFDAILAAAAEWREAWREDGDAEIGRRSLGQWLKREDYLCVPTRRRKPASARSTQKPTPPAENDNRASAANVVPVRARPQPRVVTIAGTEVVKEGGSSMLALNLVDNEGNSFAHRIILEHDKPADQDAGQRLLQRLCVVTGLGDIEESEVLVGSRFILTERAAGPHYDAIEDAA